MRPRKVTRNDVLMLTISIFIVVCAWVGFNIHHARVTSTITPELQQQVLPIDPTFDTQTINQLREREVLQPFYEAEPPKTDVIPTSQLQPSPLAFPTLPSPENVSPTIEQTVRQEEQSFGTIEGQ